MRSGGALAGTAIYARGFSLGRRLSARVRIGYHIESDGEAVWSNHPISRKSSS
jgi:hypothetical protein